MPAWPKRPWPDAVPRFVTPRNPERETLGPELVETARLLGYEPMPWQAQMWDTQYEYTLVETDQGVTKQLWYREARITVPRQSAKTTSTLVRQVHRCRMSEAHGWGHRPVAAFTMQHASDARDKLVNDWMPAIEYGPLVDELLGGDSQKGFVLSNGKESVKWANGSRMVTFPPTAAGAHGGVYDLVDIDEAFAFPDNRAEQGSRHAMITRKSPQICIQSTAGTFESTYLRAKVDDGRMRCESGEYGHVYYVEYSIGPEDDINNPAHWPRWMPALGYTINIEAVKLEHDTIDAEEFYRAYGNGWTGSSQQVIPATAWERAFHVKTKRTTSRVWMAVDASPGMGGRGRSASIAIASYRDTESGGKEVHVEVLATGAGLSWVPGKIAALTRKHKVDALYVDSTGPIRQILTDIKDVSMANVTEIDVKDMVGACGRFHQSVLDNTVRHRHQAPLDAAVAGAGKRVLEDQWAWKRRTSASDISPLVAATLAHWGACINGDRGPIRMHTAK